MLCPYLNCPLCTVEISFSGSEEGANWAGRQWFWIQGLKNQPHLLVLVHHNPHLQQGEKGPEVIPEQSSNKILSKLSEY